MFWWLILLVIFLGWFYRWATENNHKWDGKGIYIRKPFLCFGSNFLGILKMPPIFVACQNLYNEMLRLKQDIIVYYMFKEPLIMVRDPDVIREIVVKKFDHFMDRQKFENILEVKYRCICLLKVILCNLLSLQANSEMAKMLLNLSEEEWKVTRASLSPVFTSGKLKAVVKGINGCVLYF